MERNADVYEEKNQSNIQQQPQQQEQIQRSNAAAAAVEAETEQPTIATANNSWVVGADNNNTTTTTSLTSSLLQADSEIANTAITTTKSGAYECTIESTTMPTTGAVDSTLNQLKRRNESVRSYNSSSLSSSSLLLEQQQQQLIKNSDRNAFVSKESIGVTTTDTATTTRQTFCIGKISKKLQNNQFIKNQQQQQNFNKSAVSCATATNSPSAAAALTGSKYIKYRTTATTTTTNSVQEAANCTQAAESGLTASPTKKTAIKEQLYINNIPTTATTATTTTVGVGNCKKKMVAVQELKKTQKQQQEREMSSDLNPCEDLSYGPGIVSKLRFRYLNLAAARENAAKQQAGLLDLRRSTSLNNLLDREPKQASAVEQDEEQEEHAEIAPERIIFSSSTAATGKTIGILKRSNNETANVGWKKTASFDVQQFNNKSDNGAVNGNGNAVNGSDAARSRQIKRGNDSLKRARSVEALLGERAHWSYGVLKSPTNNVNVSIEDKIIKARERLLSGTDNMPPKRLTSIIDDTERPPADLVKQTLRIFEATANRRGRNVRNANAKGEVANKVANYKYIINEQKPAILHAKPMPQSATAASKKVSPKTAVAATTTLHSPTAAAAPTMTSTPKSNASTMSLIHKQKQLLLERQQESVSATNAKLSPIESPLSALSKKLEKFHIETPPTNTTKPSAAADKDMDKNASIGERINNFNLVAAGGDIAALNNNSAADVVDKNADRSDKIVKKERKNQINDYEDDDDDDDVDDDEQDNDNQGNDDDDNDNNDRVAVDDYLLQSGINASANSSNDFSAVEYSAAEGTTNKRVTKTVLEKIAKAGTTQQFKFYETTTATSTTIVESTNLAIKARSVANCNTTPTPTTVQQQQQQQDLQANNIEIAAAVLHASPASKQIGIIRPILTSQTQRNQQQQQKYMETLKQTSSSCSGSNSNSSISTHSLMTSSIVSAAALTSWEIEKNRINEMKKNDICGSNADNNATANSSSTTTTTQTTTTTTTSLDNNVIADKQITETDASVASGSVNSPIWAQLKRRQVPPPAIPENNSMVFNFSNRKEVPDYIENDGVTFRRKRELPKPNESGFVILDDISSSTDTDFDDFSMCPPSPCDVEFENANIVIDGKSSIRQKSKEATFRVQFNDTLTSTFEYPSEASLSHEETFRSDQYMMTAIDQMEHYVGHICFDSDNDAGPIQKHHHVTVDEIIQLPTSNNAAAASDRDQQHTTKSVLGSLPLGSAPLGLYSPLKAPLDASFQLGVTRATSKSNNGSNGSIVGISSGLIDGGGSNQEEPDSLQYLKPASDDLTIAYSEGANKTDLLY